MKLPRELAYSWEAELVRLLGGSPKRAAVIVAIVVGATFFGPGYAFGLLPIQLSLQNSIIPLDPYSWAAIITSLLAGFTVFALPYAQMRHQADIAALAPVIPSLDEDGLRALYARIASRGRRGRVIASLVGWACGFLIPIFAAPGSWTVLTGQPDFWQPDLPPEAYWAAGWFVVVVPLLVASLAKAGFQMVSGARRVLREVENRVEVSALEADALRPLANAGLHTSFIWMIGVAIGMLFVLDTNIDSTVIIFFLLSLAPLGGLAGIAPALAGKRIIRRAKDAALSDVRKAIARLHLQALDPASSTAVRTPDDQRLAQMGALLAYEDRLEDAQETPINAPTLARFILYLAIPVGSWLGGAFMERLVDAALG